MPSDISIRQARIEDADAILECLHQAFAPYRGHYSREAFEDAALTDETLRQRLTEMTMLVAADQSGRTLGTVAYRVKPTGEGHFRGMAVLPEAQRTGVARLLLERVESDLRDLGCRAVTLDTTAPLERAIHFYEHHGFCATGAVGSFFGMPLFEYHKRL
jgi:ribosomal protein S18 acetylase RimI-like enzyme